ncbi:MAG: hypothetical protein EON60_08110 [Alphaproteobacteria bacterium]|nr:MAG: hypothetical protein EON60_08110 [Alphaproteobacteria bacterium]
MNITTSSIFSTLNKFYLPMLEARRTRSYNGYDSLCQTKSLLIGQIPAALRDDLLSGLRFVQYEPATGFYNPLLPENMHQTTRLEHIHKDDLNTYLDRLTRLGLGAAVY